MSSLRNQLRPKHQVLILKCYPKVQRQLNNNTGGAAGGAGEVKPNSSELSYLLYYASTRRSKIQKVGAFLERKTEADVRRGKTGNVQVTLAILAALIEKTRRDLTLYAPYVLRILKVVLASNKLGLVEDSVKVFQAFCEHQDVATFAADQSLVRLYEDVVKTYASFATKSTGGKTPMNKPMSVRWRTAGLTAIESITKSEAITVDGGLQLSTIIPVILDNLHYASEEQLIALYSKLENEEKTERDPARGRPSMATQRTNDTTHTTDGTTEDADRIAEEEVGVLALQSIKQIFNSNNRGQIRVATQSMLKFVLEVVRPANIERRPGTAKTTNTTTSMLVGSWATAIVQMLTRWTPVQDRFVIMVTIMEELVKSPIAEENVEPQLVLAILVDSLLSSSINMIGLSVMDVLIGLVQHILLLLQLGGRGSNILPHHQQTDAIDLFGEADKRLPNELAEPVAAIVDDPKDEKHPSTTRQRLLDRLRICIGALANHIYYSDQISDMIAAILLRLKPSPLSSVSSPVAAVENPEAAAQAISDSVKMQEDPRTDSFFSFGTARVMALNAIKEVLVVANLKASVTGAGAVGRNRVPVQTWEGTQWLLRDEDRRVRRAYVDALTTWLRLEMSKHDLSVMEDRESRRARAEPANGKEPARALSSASRRSKTAKAPKSSFLQLLHLAIYDNAIETPETESEILLLHLLLYHLVEKLGVNSVQHGLPMIVRLQEDINMLEAIGTPKAKIVVGSLVHGYLWTIMDRFEFPNTLVGHEIMTEIQRRKKSNMWLQAINMPPVPLEKILIAGSANAIRYLDPEVAQTGSLRPFDALDDLVNQIAIAYDNSLSSPPTSPPGSPGKAFNGPILTAPLNTSRARELPGPIRDTMLSRWTKAACLASIENSIARSGSQRGSQRGTLRSMRNGYLNVAADTPRGTPPRDSSPGSENNGHLAVGSGGRRSLRKGLSSVKGGASLTAGGLNHSHPLSSVGSETGTPSSGIVRFGELKRMLADNNDAGASPRNTSIDGIVTGSSSSRKHPLRRSISIGSESMVDADGVSDSDDDGALSPASTRQSQQAASSSAASKPQTTPQAQQPQSPTTVSTARSSRRASQTKYAGTGSGSTPGTPTRQHLRTRSSSTASAEDPDANARALKGEIVPPVVRSDDGHYFSSDDVHDPDAVPPVPPLPEGLIGNKASVVAAARIAAASVQSPTGDGVTAKREVAATSTLAGDAPVAGDKRVSNAARILSGIDIGKDERGDGGGYRPPY